MPFEAQVVLMPTFPGSPNHPQEPQGNPGPSTAAAKSHDGGQRAATSSPTSGFNDAAAEEPIGHGLIPEVRVDIDQNSQLVP